MPRYVWETASNAHDTIHLCTFMYYTHMRTHTHTHTNIASVTLKVFFFLRRQRKHLLESTLYSLIDFGWRLHLPACWNPSHSPSNIHISQWAWVNPRPPAAETEGKTRIDNFRLPARRLHQLYHRSSHDESHDWESIHDSLLFVIYILYVQYTYVWVCVFIYIQYIYI